MVIFEALSGRLAHDASGQMAMIASKLERSARSLRDLAQVPVPAGLDTLVARALARNPADRFTSAHELLRAWRALGPATIMPRVVPIYSGATNIMPTQTVMTAGLSGSASGRTSKLGLAVAGVALFGATVLLVFVLFGRPHTSSAAVAQKTAAPPAPTAAAIDPSLQPGAQAAPPADPPPADSNAAAPPDPPDPQANAAPPPTPAADPPPRKPTRAYRQRPVSVPTVKKVSTGPHIQEKPRY
jgi:eukaryotic-like serine/threonine-protein kinase